MSARITGAFRVEEVPGQLRGGRQCVKLLEPLEYHVGSEDSSEVITVPAGFVTDFASVPYPFRNMFPALGPWARAAIVHDWLYDQGGLGRYTRLQCDRIFLEAMTVLGVPAWKRTLMFRAVRIGGGSGFDRQPKSPPS